MDPNPNEYDPTLITMKREGEEIMYCLDDVESADPPKYSSIMQTTVADKFNANLATSTPHSSSSMQPSTQQQYYLLNEDNQFYQVSKHVRIAPKIVPRPTTAVNGAKPPNLAARQPTPKAAEMERKKKKRDERSRATHNEVERRRRDKINHWIEKLGQLIPVDGEPEPRFPMDRPNVMSGESSKSEILSKACDYVTALHRKVNILDECKKESQRIGVETKRLHEANAQLAVENDQLRERLRKLGISPPAAAASDPS